MADIRITNCHVHTFTTDHTPRYFPHWFASVFRALPFLIRILVFFASLLPWEWLHERLVRLENLHRTGGRKSQRDVFLEVWRQYPDDTQFVVLPLDMGEIGHGPIRAHIRDQHNELAALKKEFPENIVPFATIDPNREGGVEEFWRCFDDLGFRGLKLYTKLGYRPDHPVLMDAIYPRCAKQGIPVMAHCSRGGVYRKGWTPAERDQVTAPSAWIPVLKEYKDLKVCLAHFGGQTEWEHYIEKGFDHQNTFERDQNWMFQILELIGSGEYPNLYTDISYTLFHFSKFSPFLKLLLEDSTLRDRVLFGSDFYMTRQEEMSERAVSLALRATLGEDCFKAIAETNPSRYLEMSTLS